MVGTDRRLPAPDRLWRQTVTAVVEVWVCGVCDVSWRGEDRCWCCGGVGVPMVEALHKDRFR